MRLQIYRIRGNIGCTMGKWSFMTFNRALLQLCLLLLMLMFIVPVFAQGEDPCVQTPSKTSERLYKKARELQKAGKKEDALEVYEELLSQDPTYLEAQYY